MKTKPFPVVPRIEIATGRAILVYAKGSLHVWCIEMYDGAEHHEVCLDWYRLRTRPVDSADVAMVCNVQNLIRRWCKLPGQPDSVVVRQRLSPAMR